MKTKKTYSLTMGKLLGVILISLIIGGSLFYSGTQAVTWCSAKYKAYTEKLSKKEKRFNWRNFSLRELLQTKPQQNVQPVKVVSEQSQVIEVVKKASPAVVSIVASAEVPKFETYYEDPFGDLPGGFGDFFNFRVPQRRQNGTEEVKIGAGTGFLVSADGYIVTNGHVVSDKNAKYVVYLNTEDSRGEKIEAKVLARDPNTDLAILKIDRDNLPYLQFSDSGKLQVGQTAITIGYALGEFDNTVSKGVVSGLSRTITAGGWGMRSEKLKNLIQTDAAINPGNSGGPMLDIEGNVIGVNVAMANAENIGFAIPGNDAKRAFEEVKQNGKIAKIKKAFLGVRYIPIDKEMQKKNNLPYDYGALIIRGEKMSDLAVTPGSPADKAGLVENDIILEVNGKRVNSRNQLADLISKYKAGDKIKLKIYHKGKEKEIEVQLGDI
jgi:S1-C subfamily serine protease